MRINKNPVTVAVLLTSLASAVVSGQTADHAFPEVTLDTAQGALLPQLAAAVQKANQQGLTPVADVGAPWCGPCVLMDSIIHAPAMRDVMQKMYVIHLNLDIWSPPLEAMGADVTTGIPRVFALDHTGRPSGEPWRPRDIPDSLMQKGSPEAFRLSLIAYFATAKVHFAQTQPAKRPD